MGERCETGGGDVCGLHFLGKDGPMIEYVPEWKGHDFQHSLDIRKPRVLSWKPAHLFSDVLEATAEWHMANDWWWPLKREIKIESDFYV